MRRLFSICILFSVMIISSCGDSEESSTMEVVGDYNATSLQAGDITLSPPNIEVSLSLRNDSTYESNGFDNIDPNFKKTGKWSLNAPKRLLGLDGMNFAVKKFEDDTLKISYNSESVEFIVTLKR